MRSAADRGVSLQGDLFKDLRGEALECLAGRLRLVALSEGEIVFRQNEPSDCLYIIKSGMAKATKSATEA